MECLAVGRIVHTLPNFNMTSQILAYKWDFYGRNLSIRQTFSFNLAICQTLTLPNKRTIIWYLSLVCMV